MSLYLCLLIKCILILYEMVMRGIENRLEQALKGMVGEVRPAHLALASATSPAMTLTHPTPVSYSSAQPQLPARSLPLAARDSEQSTRQGAVVKGTS